MSSRRFASLVALESSSVQIGQRCLVLASVTVIGAFLALYRARSLSGTAPLGSLALRTIALPGLKPSARLMSDGSIGTPSEFFGICASLRFSRRPVSVVLSALVSRSLGNGSSGGAAAWATGAE